jgi:hypothetical protein
MSAFGLSGLLASAGWSVRADELLELPVANGRREIVTQFPQKGP